MSQSGVRGSAVEFLRTANEWAVCSSVNTLEASTDTLRWTPPTATRTASTGLCPRCSSRCAHATALFPDVVPCRSFLSSHAGLPSAHAVLLPLVISAAMRSCVGSVQWLFQLMDCKRHAYMGCRTSARSVVTSVWRARGHACASRKTRTTPRPTGPGGRVTSAS